METPMKVQRTLPEFGSYGPVADAKAQTDCGDGSLPTVAFSSSPEQTVVDPLSPVFDPNAEDEESHGEQSKAEDPTLGDGGKAVEPPEPECEKEAYDALLAEVNKGKTTKRKRGMGAQPERMRKKRKRVHAAEDEACGSGALPKKKKRSAKSQEERAQLIHDYLAQYGKQLDTDSTEALLKKRVPNNSRAPPSADRKPCSMRPIAFSPTSTAF